MEGNFCYCLWLISQIEHMVKMWTQQHGQMYNSQIELIYSDRYTVIMSQLFASLKDAQIFEVSIEKSMMKFCKHTVQAKAFPTSENKLWFSCCLVLTPVNQIGSECRFRFCVLVKGDTIGYTHLHTPTHTHTSTHLLVIHFSGFLPPQSPRCQTLLSLEPYYVLPITHNYCNRFPPPVPYL